MAKKTKEPKSADQLLKELIRSLKWCENRGDIIDHVRNTLRDLGIKKPLRDDRELTWVYTLDEDEWADDDDMIGVCGGCGEEMKDCACTDDDEEE